MQKFLCNVKGSRHNGHHADVPADDFPLCVRTLVRKTSRYLIRGEGIGCTSLQSRIDMSAYLGISSRVMLRFYNGFYMASLDPLILYSYESHRIAIKHYNNTVEYKP
ncbi:hypothetical protein NPIL_675181 [Nephila pilipes]|uniref:Uncharacterized protein n=1 Tax=Nephila pilipes TaxID=299642 RepID=A0A8X6N4Q2_NEPPI|nr:hypothetical protein NPIL_675181 [Nephila pilipes]